MMKKLLLLFLLSCGTALAQTTDYVNSDDVDCDDTIASGSTTTAIPWCSPPGTRNAGDTATTNTNALSCGDTVLLFGGTTQDSDDPAGGGSLGYWDIDTEYADCGAAAQNPITIRIATDAEWSGSSGNYTLDGTGVTLDTGDPVLLWITGRDKVHIRGRDTTNRIVVRDSASIGAMVASSDRIWLRYMQITNSLGTGGGNSGGLKVSLTNDSLFQDMEIDNAGGRGLFIGDGDADTNRITFWTMEIHNNGDETNCAGDGGGVWAAGDGRKWFNFLDVYENDCEGLQAGVLTDGTGIDADIFMQFRNIESYAHDTQTNNQTDSAHQMSGDQNGTTPATNPTYTFGDGFEVIQTFTRFRFWGGGNQGENMQSGHGGGFTEFWNGVSIQTAGAIWYYDEASDYSAGYNLILADPAGLATFALVGGDSSGGAYQVQREPKIYATSICTSTGANNAVNFDGTCSEDANLGCTVDEDCTGTCDRTDIGVNFTYNSPPDFIVDNADITVTTSGCEAIFTDVSGGCSGAHPFTAAEYATCDLTLETGASEIDAGRCFLYTTNSGSSSTGPINVRASVQDEHDNFNTAYALGDPRRFFYDTDAEGDDATVDIYAPAGSGIPADPVEIGGTETTIASMTSSSITVADAITWSNGDCVHYPYNGSLPDIGYIESTPAAGGGNDAGATFLGRTLD